MAHVCAQSPEQTLSLNWHNVRRQSVSAVLFGLSPSSTTISGVITVFGMGSTDVSDSRVLCDLGGLRFLKGLRTFKHACEERL